MFNTRITKERGVPLWAIGAPAIGVPLMVALLALVAPRREMPVEGVDLRPTIEKVERQAMNHASGLSSDCTLLPSGS